VAKGYVSPATAFILSLDQLSIYEVYTGTTWRLRLNHPWAAVMCPYVELFEPLAIAEVSYHNKITREINANMLHMAF